MNNFRKNIKSIKDLTEKFIIQTVYANIEDKKDFDIIKNLKAKKLSFFLKPWNISHLQKIIEENGSKTDLLSEPIYKLYNVTPEMTFETLLWKIVFTNLALDFLELNVFNGSFKVKDAYIKTEEGIIKAYANT